MAYVLPTVSEFKSRFDRDFPYSTDQTDLTKVRDKDITLAQTQAAANFNVELWENQTVFAEAFNLLSAHYLCSNLLASSQGVRGAGVWLTNSKTVGNVSESFNIPERVMKSPTLSLYSRTTYGCVYLSIIAVRLIGNVAGIFRRASAT